jgi:hypothetical protein
VGWTAADTGDYRLNGTTGIHAGSDSLYPANADAVGVLAGVTLSDAAKTAITAALSKDLAGSTRKQGTAIDMGAYEKQ